MDRSASTLPPGPSPPMTRFSALTASTTGENLYSQKNQHVGKIPAAHARRGQANGGPIRVLAARDRVLALATKFELSAGDRRGQ